MKNQTRFHPSASNHTSRVIGGRNERERGRFYSSRAAFLLVLFGLTLWLNLSFLKPLVMGALFAIILYPMMRKLEPTRLGPIWRAGLVTCLFTVIVLVPLGILIVAGADAALSKMEAMQNFDISKLQNRPAAILDMLQMHPVIAKISDFMPVSEEQLSQWATKGLINAGQIVSHVLEESLASLPGLLLANIIIVFAIFFFLIDGPKAVDFLRENSFFNRKQTDHLFKNASALCYSVVVSSVAAGITHAALIGIVCLMTGKSSIALFMLCGFVASFFPVIGTAPVTFFLLGQSFYDGDSRSGIIWIVAICVIGIADNLVRPWVIKGGASLHPLIAFVSAFGALEAIGFYGLFIGPVVTGMFFLVLPIVTKSFARSGPIRSNLDLS